MKHFREMTPDVYTWSRFSQEKQLDFNGTVLVMRKRSVLIDPVDLSVDAIEELRKVAPPEAILLTNKDHRRSAPALQASFGNIPVWIHENDRPLLDMQSQHGFSGNSRIHFGIEAIHLEHMKSPGECAFFWSVGKGVMILGDALIGKPKGELSFLPVEKIRRPDLARHELQKLLHYSFQTLILGDGESFVSGGKGKLQEFLTSP